MPRSIQDGIILSIDPGTRKLGWSVSHIHTDDGTITRTWIARGTVFSKGTGSALISGIACAVRDIQNDYNVETIAIEDYIFIPGHTSGVFAVPALIGVLKTDWYRKTGKEAIMIEAATWKKTVCDNSNANKLFVKNQLQKILGADVMRTIEEEFRQHALKEQQDPQDCFDAIAIDLYIYMTIKRYAKEKEALFDTQEL